MTVRKLTFQIYFIEHKNALTDKDFFFKLHNKGFNRSMNLNGGIEFMQIQIAKRSKDAYIKDIC